MKALDPGLLLIGLLVLMAASPLFPAGLPSIADAPIHLFRTMEMVSSWMDGVYYPRWAPNLAFGYGYPLFDFAPPFPYILAGTFHVLGFSLENSIKLLSALCLACYGLGMYFFARNVLGVRGALLAAAAYIYTPFRFREILLYGGNYPQILAIGLFPWVLWAFERVVADGRRRYVVGGALSFGALILSHNFHAFFFTPLLILFIALNLALKAVLPRSDQSHTGESRLLHVLKRPGPALAFFLGLVLTAFFWAPALHDLRYTIAQGDYYLARSDFRLRLLNVRDLIAPPVALDGRAENPYVPFSLGVVVLILATMGVVYLLVSVVRLPGPAARSARHRGTTGREVAHLTFFLLTLSGTSFLMLRPAAPLWETLPFLPYAEFPWRLMGIANLSAAFLAGGSVRLWERSLGSRRKGSILADSFVAVSLLGLVLGVAVYLYPVRAFLRWDTPSLSDYIDYEERTQNLGTTGLAEYLPVWAEEIPSTSPLAGPLRQGEPIEKLDRSTVPAGAEATLLAHDATSDRYRFNSGTDFRARFYTFYFPGWRAYLDAEPVPIQISAPLGLIAVAVPAGEHELLLRFGETPFRLAMDLISAAGGLGLVGWLVIGTIRGRQRGASKSGAGGPAMPEAKRWSRSGSGWLGLLLVVLFLAKLAYVDPHTTWFRQQSPPDQSPPDQVLNVQHPMRVQLEDNVLFVGYDLIGDEVVRAGKRLQVRLYWQATGPVSGDYLSFVHLDAPPDNATFASSDNFHPGDPQAQNDVPSLGWNPALYVRDEHRLLVPQEIPSIAYSVRVGLYERESGRRLSVLTDQGGRQSGDTVHLQMIHVLSSRQPRLARIEKEEAFRLGETIELLGHRVEAGAPPEDQVQAGGAISVTLYWRASAPVEKDYTVFVHLVDEAGQVQSQRDGLPKNGRYPTSNWLPYQIVEDQATLAIPPDLPAGEYRIAVGMYELATGQRLPVTDQGVRVPDDAIILDRVLRLGNPTDG